LKNYRILIVGASGLVGSNCFKCLNQQEHFTIEGTYFKFSRPELHYYDTLNPGNPGNFDIKHFQPTHILHAGALTHVDFCEQNPAESYEQTVTSTRNILEIASETGAIVIYISTDYLFDGHSGPYDEKAVANPISVYGKHKLEAEQLVLSQSADNLVLRVTNVYGNEVRNKNFISRLLDLGIAQRESELNLPSDQYATPVNAWDIARALCLLIKDRKNGIYNIASTDYLNRVQLAEKILSKFPGHKVKINALQTELLKQHAARPLQGGLKSLKFLAEYPYFEFSSVDEYLNSKVLR
jgi:dTDP-4-dehydrorhamnose reductase